ncbi:MAG: hypothetical protein IPL50_00310 [Chitinophagaceae bacterium]|nr:hypothetical protein [Chitinophagaceae bacterium]
MKFIPKALSEALLPPHAPIPEISGPVQLATLVWSKVVVPQTAIAVWGVIQVWWNRESGLW